ncbi:MAG: GspH/FimT family pseudopilin [Burkholderiaceae bacterium]|nr:GspH/FimT family pseudopilin [Burkholderiaceae bacterium]
MRPSRGMTMIELAVTMVILAMLLVGAGPSIGAWMRNTQVRNTASSIQAGLNHARNEAMRRNAPIRFSLVSLADSAVMGSSCALSGAGVSWVVSVRDPSANCQFAPVTLPGTSADAGLVAAYLAAVADASNPLIVEANAGGVGGKNVVVAARTADNSAAANTVTFNAFGRVADATPIGFINVSNDVAGNDYRGLRIEIGNGGTVRTCDRGIAAGTDPRYCPTTVLYP